MALLLYHTLVATDLKNVDVNSDIFKSIGKSGILTYKFIFKNNNGSKRKDFFKPGSLIPKIWDFVIRDNLTYDMCFQDYYPDTDIWKSYSEVAKNLSKNFGLEMPEFWFSMFSE